MPCNCSIFFAASFGEGTSKKCSPALLQLLTDQNNPNRYKSGRVTIGMSLITIGMSLIPTSRLKTT